MIGAQRANWHIRPAEKRTKKSEDIAEFLKFKLYIINLKPFICASRIPDKRFCTMFGRM